MTNEEKKRDEAIYKALRDLRDEYDAERVDMCEAAHVGGQDIDAIMREFWPGTVTMDGEQC